MPNPKTTPRLQIIKLVYEQSMIPGERVFTKPVVRYIQKWPITRGNTYWGGVYVDLLVYLSKYYQTYRTARRICNEVVRLFKVKKGFEIYAPKKDKLPADHKGLKQALYINRTGRFDKKERALTQEELDAIEHYPLPHIKLERIRAIFMVLAYTGMDQKVARTLRLHKGQIFLDKKPYQGPGADRIAPFLQTIGEWPVWFTPFSVRMRAMFRAALPPKGITYITVGGQPRVLDRYKILSMETGKNTFRALNLPPKKKKSKTGLSQREAMKLMWDKYRAMTPEQRAAQVPKVSYSRKGSRKGKQYKGRGGLLRGLGLSELYFKNTQNQDTTQNQNNP